MTIEARAKTTGRKAYCRKCNLELQHRVHRPWAVKRLLFFVPVRKYVCTNCLTGHYLLKQ